VRIDASVGEGDTVSPYYDPMLAKLICHEPSRQAAAARLAAACGEVRAWPVKTNAWLLSRCLTDPGFVAGNVDTGFIEARLDALAARPKSDRLIRVAAAAAFVLKRSASADADPWADGLGGFRLNRAAGTSMRLYEDGEPIDLTLVKISSSASGSELSGSMEDAPFTVSRSRDGAYRVEGQDIAVADAPNGDKVVFAGGAAFAFHLVNTVATDAAGGGDGALRTPMPGRIVSLGAKVGDTVKLDQPLVILEAMKMEHALKAPFDGEVIEVTVKEGDQVAEGTVVVRLKPA
jgi:propionyl-CoA carboxylase alpha chain/3-methylcrotonyl-CoA carboxylase alpha subunit